MTDLKGKTALVTGSTSGIGRATAIALAARGARVLVVGRNERRARDVVAEIEGGGGSAAHRLTTLSDLESALDLVQWATEAGDGHVDILINNAGVALLGPSSAATEPDFDQTFALNVKVPFFLVAELAWPSRRNSPRRSSSSPVTMPASSRGSPSRSTGAGSRRDNQWQAGLTRWEKRMSKFDAQFAGRLDGQTVLVTGAKGGIGHQTAQGAGNSGATVLVHARRADQARQAAAELAGNGNGSGRYLAVAADLGSLAGVRELVEAVREASPRGLNGLVNNAGAAFAAKALSPDGYERTIAINHVALAALTDGLLDLLRKGADDFAAPSRVVTMTALIESRGTPITDWSYPGRYKQIQVYADAKLLALMYTYAQARRHEGQGLTFNAVSPGAVKTTLGSTAGGPFKTIEALTNPFVGPPEKGSRGCVRLLADPALATATGGYYSSAKLKKSSKKSRDRDAQDRVYEQTERELRIHR